MPPTPATDEVIGGALMTVDRDVVSVQRNLSASFDLAVTPSEDDINPYEVLGLERTCSAAEIKKAYRKLVLKFHPDKHKDSSVAEVEHAANMMHLVGIAHTLLSDAHKRKQYDAGGRVSDILMLDDGPDRRTARARHAWALHRQNTPCLPPSPDAKPTVGFARRLSREVIGGSGGASRVARAMAIGGVVLVMAAAVVAAAPMRPAVVTAVPEPHAAPPPPPVATAVAPAIESDAAVSTAQFGSLSPPQALVLAAAGTAAGAIALPRVTRKLFASPGGKALVSATTAASSPLRGPITVAKRLAEADMVFSLARASLRAAKAARAARATQAAQAVLTRGAGAGRLAKLLV